MSKTYSFKVKYGVGDEVWMIKPDAYDQKRPQVIVGTICQIKAIVNDDGEVVPQFRVIVAQGWRPEDDYYEAELLTEKEARKYYETYCQRLKTFDDGYLKAQLDRAHKLINAWEKKDEG